MSGNGARRQMKEGFYSKSVGRYLAACQEIPKEISSFSGMTQLKSVAGGKEIAEGLA